MDKRILSWLLVSTVLFFSLIWLRNWLLPPPVKPAAAASRPEAKASVSPEQRTAAMAMLQAGLAAPFQWQLPTDLAIPHVLDAHAVMLRAFAENQRVLAEPDESIVLDPPGAQIRVVVSKRGAAVRSVTLHKFKEADRKTASPVDRELVLVSDIDPEEQGVVPAADRLKRQSYRLLVDSEPPAWNLRERKPDQVVFEALLPQKNARILKSFSLKADQYHVDLEVKIEPINTDQKCELAYELSGPQGVPVEGEYWKTTPYRYVVVGSVDAGATSNLRRRIFGPATLDPKRENKAQPIVYDAALGQEFQYAGVMNQFFAALTVVNITKDEPAKPRPIAQVVPQYIADEVADKWTSKHKPLMGQISVSVTSRPVKLEKGKSETHSYLLYTGPVKVMLLAYEKEVRSGLWKQYANDLHLDTLTDYPSEGGVAWFFYYIGWTRLLIFCTNLMHELIHWLNYLTPAYPALTIVLLTFLVRMAMFPVSRKQAITMQKTQKLAPELAKLKEKYKDDVQQLMQAQRELYKKHGVNPASGCLIVLLQMPVFMGLYYALQESVHLRLSSFLWAENLAAPDMLIRWDTWPVINWLADLLHLGPYFHLLPVISIALIIVQQKLTMPPAVDEQTKMQMRMMNIMMYFMAWAFYWVAAGLCLYFTVSGIWGMVERRFLPKKDATTTAQSLSPPERSGASGQPAGPSGRGPGPRAGRVQPASRNGQPDSLLNKVAAWWKKLLEQAEKK